MDSGKGCSSCRWALWKVPESSFNLSHFKVQQVDGDAADLCLRPSHTRVASITLGGPIAVFHGIVWGKFEVQLHSMCLAYRRSEVQSLERSVEGSGVDRAVKGLLA